MVKYDAASNEFGLNGTPIRLTSGTSWQSNSITV
jgi:hypothetical protein